MGCRGEQAEQQVPMSGGKNMCFRKFSGPAELQAPGLLPWHNAAEVLVTSSPGELPSQELCSGCPAFPRGAARELL